MLHVFRTLTSSSSGLRSFFTKITPNSQYGYKIQPNHSNFDDLLKVADNFMRQNKVRKAEEIYKQVIDSDPTCREAYQKLWNSWNINRGLRVTAKELDDFMDKYKKYIEPKEEGSSLKLK